MNPDSSPQFKKALDSLPQRPHMGEYRVAHWRRAMLTFQTDLFVQIFFNNVNYHYYIIYPPRFLEQYQEWWDRRAGHEPLNLQWTALLVVICACATQHLELDVKPRIEADLGEPAEQLTERYQQVSRELAGMIPNGRYHLINIQRMLHEIYWYKSEARFVEAWHLIGAAVRESQELGNATTLCDNRGSLT